MSQPALALNTLLQPDAAFAVPVDKRASLPRSYLRGERHHEASERFFHVGPASVAQPAWQAPSMAKPWQENVGDSEITGCAALVLHRRLRLSIL